MDYKLTKSNFRTIDCNFCIRENHVAMFVGWLVRENKIAHHCEMHCIVQYMEFGKWEFIVFTPHKATS